METTLAINTHLRELYLENNKIGNAGVINIANILYKNPYLEVLSLHNNRITNDGKEIIEERERDIPNNFVNKFEFMEMKVKNEQFMDLVNDIYFA